MTQPAGPPAFQASTAAQADLATASAQAVTETFTRLARYWTRDRWLGAQNSYRQGTVQAIKNDVTNSVLNQKHLAEYIAASVPLHASDGWAFLGRAMQAHLLGDRASARHLAYYAELRAAMTILAAHGIGIFDRQHFVVTNPTTVKQVAGSAATHTFTWQALNWWAGRPGSWNVVGQTVRPLGVDLNYWLSTTPQYAAWGPVASSWITSLGLDIQRVASDQYSRNEASYRPTRIIEQPHLDGLVSAQFAVNLWRALEPGPSGFPNLDLHILRVMFDRAFEAVEGGAPSRYPARFASAARTLSTAASLPEPSRLRVEQFLCRNTESNDLEMLREAAIDTNSTHPRHHLQIMSRAASLLVIATAAVRRLVESAGSQLADTAFWWQTLGAERGLWHTAPPTSDLRDLWQDIEIEVERLEDWLARPGAHSYADFVADCPTAFARLSQFELAALWGMTA